MASEQSATVIIPAFNEEDVIQSTLDLIVESDLHQQYDFVFVDDGSDDRTPEIIARYPVRLFRHPVNKGYGAALKTGIRAATGKKIITMDSDGQHHPRYIAEIDKMLETHDMVIGERIPGSRQGRKRKAGKKIIGWIGAYLVEQKLPDYNSGYRGFHKEIIVGLLHLMPNGFSFSTTSTMAFLKEGYMVGTIPIEVAERKGRKSNVKMVRDGSKTLLLLLRIIMLFNPLKVFFPASLISFIVGIIYGVTGYILFGRFSNGGVVLTMLGMFLFFIGLMADQISILNRRKQ